MHDKHKRVKRTTDSLISALRNHRDLLNEYINRAIDHSEYRFLGEIAGKLRVLVYRSQSNRPLLLDLMAQHDFRYTYRFDYPGKIIEQDLEEMLGSISCALRVSPNELIKINNIEFIALWAQQSGAAHEDWEHDVRLATAFNSQIIIGGLPSHMLQLISIAKNILMATNAFLDHIEKTKCQ